MHTHSWAPWMPERNEQFALICGSGVAAFADDCEE
ncbi:MAG: hypothetical protein ACI91Q_001386, partial [Gammaproteobacteria bacterium]